MGKFLKTKGGFVIDRPGRVVFFPVKADGTIDYANAIRNTAPINTITITNSRTKTNIPDGNAFYPAGDRVTDIAGTVAIDFSTIDPAIWAMASGSAMKETAVGKILKMYDYMRIESDGTLKIEDKYVTDGYINVLGSDGKAFEKASGEPAGTGEYSVAVSSETPAVTTLTFSTEDAGKTVAVTMDVETKTSSYSIGQKTMKYHKIVIATELSTLNDSEKVDANFEISQASLGGDMVDALQKDPSATKTLTFNMYAPLPGEEPYKVTFEDKTEG